MTALEEGQLILGGLASNRYVRLVQFSHLTALMRSLLDKGCALGLMAEHGAVWLTAQLLVGLVPVPAKQPREA